MEKTLAAVFPNGNAFLSVRRYEDEDECKSGKAPCANSEDYACINRLDGYSCVPKLLRNDITIKFNDKEFCLGQIDLPNDSFKLRNVYHLKSFL